jgi:hypothetical protein
MNSFELHNILKYLVPDANLCVWGECERKDYHGESEPVIINGLLVDWHLSNKMQCPTEKEVNNVDIEKVNLDLDVKRKSARDDMYKKDLSMINGFNIYLLTNPDSTFNQYLDYLESITL